MKILACLDGSKTTKDALRFIGVLGRKPGTEIMLLHVKDKTKKSAGILSEGACILKEYGILASMKARSGDVLKEIVDEAKADYDLVVIGSQGVREVEVLFFGELSYKLIQSIKKPVLVVKKGRKDISSILACTGGSQNAMKAIDFSTGIARAANAKLTLLHVSADAAGQKTSGKVLDDCRDMLRKKGIEAETIMLRGKPAKKILETAKKGDYDLIILGEDVVCPPKPPCPGSVAYEVLKNASIPCMIVK